VATDLVTGRPKVFDKGEVAQAMRASMSVPGLIAPAEVDGMLLVDGGLVNNLPVDVARAMGADIVIAVNLGTPLMRRDQIKDVLGITGQMIGILTEQNVQATLATLRPADVLILPELGEFSAGDFDQLRKTLPIGEAAARKVAERLEPLGLSAEQFAAIRTRQTAPVPPDTRVVDAIEFAPMQRVNPTFLAGQMDTKAGEPIEQARLDADLRRIYGTGDFERVGFRLIESPTERILNVEAIEKNWGPNYLKFGLGLSSDFSGNSYFSVLGQYRRTWMNSYGGEWRTNVALGRPAYLES
jgi:NTE family protein